MAGIKHGAKHGKVLVLLNDLLVKDFELIVDSLEFKENLIIISDLALDKDDFSSGSSGKYGGMIHVLDDLKDVDSLIRKLSELKRKNDLDFLRVIGLDEEYNYRFSKAISDHFNLKTNSDETIQLVSDKYSQIAKLQKGGVTVPNFRLFNTYEEVSDFPLPSVIKPVKSISSAYVYRNNSIKELKRNIKELETSRYDEDFISQKESSQTGLASSKSSPASKSKDVVKQDVIKQDSLKQKDFIIEEFIDGNEYSCDFLVSGRVTVLRVIKKIVSKKYFPFFEGFHLFNPDKDPDSEFTLQEITDVCGKIASSLDIVTGVCMVDFRFDKKMKRIKVIETTIRPGIDDFMILMMRKYGYLSINILLRDIFGKFDPDSFSIPSASSTFVYLLAPKGGKIKSIDTSSIKRLALPRALKKEVVSYDDVGSLITYYDSSTPAAAGYVIIDNINIVDLDSIVSLIQSHTDIRMA